MKTTISGENCKKMTEKKYHFTRFNYSDFCNFIIFIFFISLFAFYELLTFLTYNLTRSVSRFANLCRADDTNVAGISKFEGLNR